MEVRVTQGWFFACGQLFAIKESRGNELAILNDCCKGSSSEM